MSEPVYSDDDYDVLLEAGQMERRVLRAGAIPVVVPVHFPSPEQMAEAAMKRLRESINRSAAQHMRHIRAAFSLAEERAWKPTPPPASGRTDRRWTRIAEAETAGEEFFMAAGRIDGAMA